jgi:hypothetical protein
MGAYSVGIVARRARAAQQRKPQPDNAQAAPPDQRAPAEGDAPLSAPGRCAGPLLPLLCGLKGRSTDAMQHKIHWSHGFLGRGGWTLNENLHLAPHPFDDDRLAARSTDAVFEYVALSRAEVERTRNRLALNEEWSGQLESVDPFDPTQRILAEAKVVDRILFAEAHIDAIVEKIGPDIEPCEFCERLIVVPR